MDTNTTNAEFDTEQWQWVGKVKVTGESADALRERLDATEQEHRRLRDAVVEACVNWYHVSFANDDSYSRRYHIMRQSIKALLAFERLHGLRERD
jgi:hypothetical protein